ADHVPRLEWGGCLEGEERNFLEPGAVYELGRDEEIALTHERIGGLHEVRMAISPGSPRLCEKRGLDLRVTGKGVLDARQLDDLRPDVGPAYPRRRRRHE